ncbi:MAG: hypothetical protein ACOWWO_13180 [Peptococcaceae bacterium]
MGISKTSSLQSRRIQSSYVNRMTSPQASNRIEPAAAVKNMENSTSFHSESALLSYDHFYEAFYQLQEQFSNYYRDEQQLGRALQELELNMEEILKQLKKLLTKYNATVDSLLLLERLVGQIRTPELSRALKTYEARLNELGVEIQGLKLGVDEAYFKESVSRSSDPIANLFRPVQKIIVTLYRIFRGLRLPAEGKGRADYDLVREVGLLVDDKG